MLHLIWYLFVGFLVGCVAKALMHASVDHVDGRARYCRLDHRRCCDPPVYPPSAGRKFHLGGLIVSIIGAVLVLYVWHKFRLQLPRGYLACLDAVFRVVGTDRRAVRARSSARVGDRALPVFVSKIDLEPFDSRLGLGSRGGSGL
jgi:uncharacterized membrane protein YeaQ/YmgE (transglycosylase-associated protein family)